MTIITDPLFYALAIPAVIALGLSKGGFAGVGQMATPMLALVMPPLEAAAIMLPIMIVQDANAVWVYRKDWNGRILAIVIPGAIVGIGVAWLLGGAYFRRRGARLHRRHHHRLRRSTSFIGMLQVPREPTKPGVAGRRVLGRAVRLHLDHLPGRRAALPDVCAARCGCRK